MRSTCKTCYTVAGDSEISAATARVLAEGISWNLSNTYSSVSGVRTDRECPIQVDKIANEPVSQSLPLTLTKVGWDGRRRFGNRPRCNLQLRVHFIVLDHTINACPPILQMCNPLQLLGKCSGHCFSVN